MSDTIDTVGFRLMQDAPGALTSSVGAPPVASRELRDHPIRPADEAQSPRDATVLWAGITVDPGARGQVDGLDVFYRVEGKRYRLSLPTTITLCGYEECDFTTGRV